MGRSALAGRRVPATCCTDVRRHGCFGVTTPPRSPVTSQPGPWGPDWTQSSGAMGTYHGHAQRHCPSAGQVWPWTPVGSHSAVVFMPLKTATNGILSRGSAPTAQAPVLPWHSVAGPPAPSGPAGSEFGWRCHGRRPWGEGQTGEAGTGTMSPVVNSTGPCSLFKALNRGWYLSSAELEAGGCWSWFNTLRHGWRDGGGTCYPR